MDHNEPAVAKTWRPGFIGVDVACAKNKRLPISICSWRSGRLVPEPLRDLPFSPPRGSGNARTLDQTVIDRFANDAAEYIARACGELQLWPTRIGIDAPSAPRRAQLRRRAAELALDQAGISCFATPTAAEFSRIKDKVSAHLRSGGAENRIPHANRLWMLVGFALFRRLSQITECIEVYPQATAQVMGCGKVHKSSQSGVAAQLERASVFTGWPSGRPAEPPLLAISWAPAHDCLDAYLSAWVAALSTDGRIAFGAPPDDVIWAPRVNHSYEPLAAAPLTPEPINRPAGRAHNPARHKLGTSDHSLLCPACRKHTFLRWPFGWDSHAAHRCDGLEAIEVERRKREFKRRFQHLFKP